MRSLYLANYLDDDNLDIKVIFNEDIEGILNKKIISKQWEESLKESDIIIFPLPISRDDKNLNVKSDKKIELEMIIDKISVTQIVMGGGLTEKVKKIFSDRGINIIDYFDRQELAVANAIPTAEGAIEIAMKELPITIYGSQCLVTGFGRVSKALINVLNGLKAKVTVVARKYEDLEWAKIYGCEARHMRDLYLAVEDQDIIFNTVPYKIMDEKVLKNIKKDCIIIELASSPGGIDLELAKAANINLKMALGLPGKVAPKTAAYMIKKTIDNILKEI